MKSYCTKGAPLVALALLLLGAAACTQPKPAVPTPTLVVFNQTPVLPASASDTPGPQETPPVAVGTSVPSAGTPVPGATEPVAPTGPTSLPTPTSSFSTAVPVATPVGATPAPSTGGTGSTGGTCTNPYTVQPGDHLYQIARQCGVTAQDLMAANPGINPNFLVPGQSLNMPGSSTAPSGGTSTGGQPSGHTYVVQRGDNLYRIALKFGTTQEVLMQMNGLSNPNYIFVGQVLQVP